MSQHDASLSAQVRGTHSGEAPFDPKELFYSRTDKRGVIIEGNGLFRRISGYGWSEIKGAPHKIIRHPDMPKGVFHFFWERLKAGKKMVAYVKNRSKEGRYYWVLALSWPLDEGYISFRVKPHSDLFRKVQELYAKLLVEEKEGLTPEKSAVRLVAAVKEMGFPTYESFMSAALSTELKERSRVVGIQHNNIQTRFIDMNRTILRIREETDEMTEVIKAIRTVPMNMRIIASRLENAGGPISAISVNYGSMLDEMATWVKEFVEGENSTFARIFNTIEHGQLLVCAAAMQQEMSLQFAEDMAGAPDTRHLEADKRTLEAEASHSKKEASEALKVVESEALRLARSVQDMKRYVTGLSSTRMMCKIESAALNGSGDSLTGIVDQLDAGQDEIEAKLAKIVELNTVIQGHTSMLKSMT